MIQKARLVFRKMTITVIMRKKSSYKHVSNSVWLPRQSYLKLQIQGKKKVKLSRYRPGQALRGSRSLRLQNF
jgi:hypothetical protein